jgi:hypothetical protein
MTAEFLPTWVLNQDISENTFQKREG